MQSLPAGDRLGRWRHRRLSLRCDACGWSAAPLIDLLAAELGAGTTLAEASARLACRACGARLSALGLVEAAPAAVPA